MHVMPSIRFLTFDQLATPSLYNILAIRQRVFQVEQQRYYLDTDGRDQIALHALAHDNGGALVGYLRILPPGVTYDTAAIGRVAIDKAWRGKGVGRQLMRAALDKIQETWGGGATLSAQLPTIPFYEGLGFKTVGEPYMEAAIEHIKMAHTG